MPRQFVALLVASFWWSVALSASAASSSSKPDASWSPVVHGLRARAYTLPSNQPEIDKTYDVWIEFQEMGLPTSLGVQHRALLMRFARPEMQITVLDAKGNPITVINKSSVTDVISVAFWDVVFPPGADISFPVGQGGSLPHSVPGQTPPKGKLLSFDPLSEWLVPSETSGCKLAITFEVNETGSLPQPQVSSVPADAPTTNSTGSGPTSTNADPAPPVIGDGPARPPVIGDGGAGNSSPPAAYNGWNGTLVLPPIDLPQQ